jgi:hypothetical protein
MSLPAIECIRRGAYNARANWELVVAHWIGLVVTAVLMIASVMPFVLILGISAFAGLGELKTPDQISSWVGDWLTRVWSDLFTISAPTMLALVAALALGTLGLVVWCFFQGGLYGVLTAGDRQAPAGPPGDWRLFRTWSADNFRGFGAHLAWRYFWFVNLALVVTTLIVGAFLALILLVAAGATSMGPAGALAVGCAGIVPIFLLLLFTGMWAWLAQADLAADDGGVGRSARRALRILGRRLGGVLLIMLLAIVASVVLAMVFLPASMIIGLATRESFGASLVLRALLTLVQWGIGGVVNVAVAGTAVALVRDERRELPA